MNVLVHFKDSTNGPVHEQSYIKRVQSVMSPACVMSDCQGKLGQFISLNWSGTVLDQEPSTNTQKPQLNEAFLSALILLVKISRGNVPPENKILTIQIN